MKKVIFCMLAALAFSAMGPAQCTTAGLNVTGSISASKCYGSFTYYNEFVDKVTYYYDYEYSSFAKSPVACQNPVTNLDTGTFWGRERTWGSNPTCNALYGCPSPAEGNETIYVSYFAHNPYHFASNILLEACQANGSTWTCSGAGLPTWSAGSPPTCDSSDATFRYNAGITNVSSYSVDPDLNVTVNITLEIYNPTYGSGLYSDNIPLVAGYRIFYSYGPQDSAPPDGYSVHWYPTDDYIAYSGGATSSDTFTFTWPEGSGDNPYSLYLAYMPVFLNHAGNSITSLFARGLTTTPNNTNGEINGYVGCVYDPPYFCEYAPTPVTMASFTGRYTDLEHVALAWVTGSESNSAGFNMYRSLDGTAWTKINASLIPAKGKGGGGASYALTDNLPKQRSYQAWQYRVEEISSGGQRTAQSGTTVTKP